MIIVRSCLSSFSGVEINIRPPVLARGELNMCRGENLLEKYARMWCTTHCGATMLDIDLKVLKLIFIDLYWVLRCDCNKSLKK